MVEALKKVYCIVVTYNGMAWIGKCLNSLMNSHYPVQVIVIDNASTDETPAFITLHFPEVQLLNLRTNKGFGAANNIGLRYAINDSADYVFLLNQDAWVEPDTIEVLIRAQESNPNLGIVSPFQMNGRGTAPDLFFKKYLGVPEHTALPDLIETPFVNAAAWLIPIDCLKATGGFAPVFFHYGEDDNYAQRVLSRGYKIVVATRTKIYHDREERILQSNPTVAAKAKKDYIIFLNQACDIRKRGFMVLWFKRTARYCILTCLNVFNKAKRTYNFSMAYRIAGSAMAIRRTRITTSGHKTIPYL